MVAGKISAGLAFVLPVAEIILKRVGVEIVLIDTPPDESRRILGSTSPLTKHSCLCLPEVILSPSFRLMQVSLVSVCPTVQFKT